VLAILIFGALKAWAETKLCSIYLGDNMKKSILSAVSGLALLLASNGASLAQYLPQLFTNVSTGQQLANPPFTLGWEFAANTNLKVVALGFFDDSQNGLAESHPVGLWNSQGALLASTTVTTTDPLVNQWRYNGIAPVVLTAGADYYVGALYTSGADNVVFPGYSGVSTTANITYLGATYAGGSSLSFPSSPDSANGFFGPNIAAAPEPATWAMMLIGFAALGFAGRRAARKSAAA
jgi:hypothetical protein